MKENHNDLDVEKSFAKFKHPFLLKILSNLGGKGNFFYLKKRIFVKPTYS